MTAPLLALALSTKLTEVGALAAFVGLMGIAILSLLVFAQAREIKRLREWAGRAPERAAELEQRVSAEAAMRIQRVVQPRPGGAPNSTPAIARAVGAQPAPPVATPTAAAPTTPPSGQSAPAVPGQPTPDQPPLATPTAATLTAAATAATPLPGQPAFVPTAQPAATPGPGALVQPATAAGVAQTAPAPKPGEEPKPDDAQQPVPATTAEGDAPQAPTGSQEPIAAEGKRETEIEEELAAAEDAPSRIAPATVAAAAMSSAAMSRVAEPIRPEAPRAPMPPPPARPTGGTGTQSEVPGRPAPPMAARPPLPPRPAARPTGVRAGSPAGAAASARPSTGFQFLREEERSPRRATALIVGGVVVGVVVLAAVVLSGGGSSSPTRGSTQASSTAGSASSQRAHHAAPAVASPAETHVVVLNATETNGLAHKLAGNLQQSGYTLAAALDGSPPGRSTSVVEYANGHRTEALQVGQTLGIGELQPLESAIAPLANGASVVVIAGASQAAPAGGEAAAGTG